VTAGYSGTPQARKLGIKEGMRVGLDNVPTGWSLTDPPAGVEFADASGPVDVVISFFGSSAELAARLPQLVRRIYPNGALWIAWPRRAAGHDSDLTGDVVRAQALPLGVVDVKVAAIDKDWSGQRVVWRLANR
jgi:hypothetical protein